MPTISFSLQLLLPTMTGAAVVEAIAAGAGLVLETDFAAIVGELLLHDLRSSQSAEDGNHGADEHVRGGPGVAVKVRRTIGQCGDTPHERLGSCTCADCSRFSLTLALAERLDRPLRARQVHKVDFGGEQGLG
jgi:hypothetical protein